MASRLLESKGTRGPLRHVRPAGVVVLGICVVGCACAPVERDAAATPAQAETQATPTVSSVPAAMLEAALDDAARRASVARTEVKVISAEAVTWPDGSAGCPEPGMMYTQALVPGHRIVLQAGEQTLHYHAGREGTPNYCPPDRAMPPASAGAAQI